MFLLSRDAQKTLIRRVAQALNPDGRFLFTAPTQPGTWTDGLTGQESLSLGAEAYKTILSDTGLTLIGEHQDRGENHYYDALKRGNDA